MDCFDTILAYANMHTNVLRNFKLKISPPHPPQKKCQWNSRECQISSTISIYVKKRVNL